MLFWREFWNWVVLYCEATFPTLLGFSKRIYLYIYKTNDRENRFPQNQPKQQKKGMIYVCIKHKKDNRSVVFWWSSSRTWLVIEVGCTFTGHWWCRCFLKWWVVPKPMGKLLLKLDHFGVWNGGYHHFRKPPMYYLWNNHTSSKLANANSLHREVSKSFCFVTIIVVDGPLVSGHAQL